ncbi:MAG: hypothetical protein JKX85_14500 [Phycisphaeraceae bacterium]|nr:hypothetical protein [Phycisphaeraceae bacterium]
MSRHRSPAYPTVSLEKCIQRASAFYLMAKRNMAPFASAANAWGYSEKSSGAAQVISALKQYGLLIDVGSKTDRKVQLTELALDIVLDERGGSQERVDAIGQAAKNPEIYRVLLEMWNDELPDDSIVKHELIRVRNFNEGKVDSFIADFRSTIEFARLAVKTSCSESMDESTDGGETERNMSVNDLKAAVTIEHPSMRQDIFTLDEGQIVLQWPSSLSHESYEDFESWITLVLRKVKRSIIVAEKS